MLEHLKSKKSSLGVAEAAGGAEAVVVSEAAAAVGGALGVEGVGAVEVASVAEGVEVALVAGDVARLRGQERIQHRNRLPSRRRRRWLGGKQHPDNG
jgi:hypothetical protein